MDTPATVLGIITAVLNAVALLFLAAQVLLARQAVRDSTAAQEREWTRLRKRATMEATMNTAQYREALKAELPSNYRGIERVTEWVVGLDANPEAEAVLNEYLNHLTDLAVGVEEEIYDLHTLSLLEGSRIIDVASLYGDYMAKERARSGKPRMWEDINILAQKLKTERGAE